MLSRRFKARLENRHMRDKTAQNRAIKPSNAPQSEPHSQPQQIAFFPISSLEGLDRPNDSRSVDVPKSSRTAVAFVTLSLKPTEPPVKPAVEVRKNDSETFEPERSVVVDRNNLLLTHESVRAMLEKRYEGVKSRIERLEKLRWIERNSEDKLERIRAQKNAFEIERFLRMVSDRREILSYERDVKILLQKYAELERAERAFVMIEDVAASANEIERAKLVRRYITITKKYVDVAMPAAKRILVCDSCSGKDFDVMEESLYACRSCGTCVPFFEETHSFKDVDRINLSSRYKYTRKTHFKEAYYNRTGQNVIVEEEVYDMLRGLCKKYGILLDTVTRDTIEMMLMENGYEKLRDYALIIHRKLTGHEVADISHLESQLLDKFDQLEEVLPKILKEYGKTNSINVDYKVLKLLEQLGVPSKREDYDIHTDKLKEYDEIFSIAYSILGWTFVPT